MEVRPLSDTARCRIDAAFLGLLGLLALAAAVHLFREYWPLADFLWWESQGDRNAHYLQGLTLAMSARDLDPRTFFDQLERMQVWGIVHPFMEGLVQLFLGPDHRLAILPSLCMWVGTAIFAFLLTRRAARHLPYPGAWIANTAGLAASLLVLASPAHRAYATDVMLESSGACLSLAVLYFYLLHSERDSRRSAITLALVWTVLFFLKYNYWLLVTFAILASEAWHRRTAILAATRETLRHPLRWLARAPFNPVLIISAALFGLALYVMKTGPLEFHAAGRTIGINRPHGVAHIAWVFFCVQLILWWRRTGRRWADTWTPGDRTIVLGTAIPIAIWFLIPKRLGWFLWFLSPQNTDQKVEHYVPFYGLSYYWKAMTDDYLGSQSLLIVIVALSAIGLLGAFRGRNAAIFAFLIISALLTFHHPMLKNRFIHSWIAVSWVTAGLGLATLLGLVARASAPFAQAAGAGLLLALGLFLWPNAFSIGRSQEGGLRTASTPVFECTDPVMAAIAPGKNVQLLCTDAESFSLKWAYLEKFRTPRLCRLDITNYNRTSQDPAVLEAWLKSTSADTIALLELTPASPFFKGYGNLDYAPLKRLLAADQRFTRASESRLPKGETITIWNRRPPPQ